jgi:electron transport complex protein RnfB
MQEPNSRGVYNEQKIKRLLADIPEIPAKNGRKKKRPRELAEVLEPSCTGCEVCIPFCPVDCIEVEPAEDWPDRTIPPVRIRYDECIGCVICVRVCEKLAWDAIVMRPTQEIERQEGLVIHETFPPGGTDVGMSS